MDERVSVTNGFRRHGEKRACHEDTAWLHGPFPDALASLTSFFLVDAQHPTRILKASIPRLGLNPPSSAYGMVHVSNSEKRHGRYPVGRS